MKNILGFLSVAVGAAAYLHMVVSTAKGTGEGLSLSTFALWSGLAWITCFTMWKQKANPAVPAIFAVGATATTIVLVAKGRFSWTSFDTLIAVLVFICVVVWITKGSKWALVLSVVAAVIAAVPFIVLSWKWPSNVPIIANSGFLLSNSLAFVAAKAWTLEDRLCFGANIVVCSLLVIPWFIT